MTERTRRALRVGLLILALSAALWPATQYSARRDLLNPVAQPAAAEQTPQPAWVFWSEAKNSFAVAVAVKAETGPLTDRHLKRQTSVYATVPAYQGTLAWDGDQTHRLCAAYEPFQYVSCCITQPAGRGPPSFV